MECKEGCGKAAYCRGLCNSAYQQWLQSREPRDATLTCRRCGKEFPNPVRQGPDRQFCSPECKGKYWRAERSRQREAASPRPCEKCGAPVAHRTGRPVCKACRIDDRDRAYRAEYMLKRALREYGLTLDDYYRTLEAQGGRCAICRSPEPRGAGRWHIDHDHVTGIFRGLLCNNCNPGIGKFGDDPVVLRAAADYIEKHRQRLATALPT